MNALPMFETPEIAYPELSGIANKQIAEMWKDLKLAVVQVHVTDETEIEALEYTKKLGTFKKNAEAAKKAALEPIKAQIATIETPYKRLITEVEKLDGMLRDGLRRVMMERRRREEERQRLERERQLKELEAAAAEYEKQGRQEDAEKVIEAAIVEESKPIEVKVSAKGMTATSFTRKVKKYEIVNPDMVPREFCEPSAGKIWKAVQAGVVSINGVRIWEEEDLAIR